MSGSLGWLSRLPPLVGVCLAMGCAAAGCAAAGSGGHADKNSRASTAHSTPVPSRPRTSSGPVAPFRVPPIAGTLNGATGPEDVRGRDGTGVLCAVLARLFLSAWPPEPAAAQPAAAQPIAKQTPTSGGSLLRQPSDPDMAFNLITRRVITRPNTGKGGAELAPAGEVPN